MCLFEREPLAATSIISSRVFRCKFIAAREKYENWFGAREMRSLKPFLSRCRESCTRCANREREREREKKSTRLWGRAKAQICVRTRVWSHPNPTQLSSLLVLFMLVYLCSCPRGSAVAALRIQKKKKKKKIPTRCYIEKLFGLV